MGLYPFIKVVGKCSLIDFLIEIRSCEICQYNDNDPILDSIKEFVSDVNNRLNFMSKIRDISLDKFEVDGLKVELDEYEEDEDFDEYEFYFDNRALIFLDILLAAIEEDDLNLNTYLLTFEDNDKLKVKDNEIKIIIYEDSGYGVIDIDFGKVNQNINSFKELIPTLVVQTILGMS